jgi:hypothetical protein
MGVEAGVAAGNAIALAIKVCPTCVSIVPMAAAVSSATSAAEGFVLSLGCAAILALPDPAAFADFMVGAEITGIGNFCQSLENVGLLAPGFCSQATAVIRQAIIAGGRKLLAEVKTWCRHQERNPMAAACTPTHNVTTRANGPGVCCAALTAAGFTSANPPPIGTRVKGTDRKGRCIVCQVEASTSKKNPGAPVIKRGKSAGLCPTSSHGCCILGTVQGAVQ